MALILSEQDKENLKSIKTVIQDNKKFLEDLNSSSKSINLSTKENLADLQSSDTLWNVFCDYFVDFIYLANAGIIKLKPANNQQFLLGCKDFSDIILGSIQSEEKVLKTEEALDSSIEYNILSLLNHELSLEDYLSTNGVSKDLASFASIISKSADSIDSEYNEAVLKDIKNGTVYFVKNVYDTVLTDILNALKLLYENTFSIYPYVAALAFGGEQKLGTGASSRTVNLNALLTPDVQDTNTASNVFRFKTANSEDGLYYTSLVNAIKSNCKSLKNISLWHGTGAYTSRCFNLKDILDCPLDSYIYYPFEAYAISSKACLEQRNDNVFKNSGCISYPDYVDTQLRPYISDLLVKYMYLVLQQNGNFVEDDNSLSDLNFTDGKFITAYENMSDDKRQLYKNLFEKVEQKIAGIVSKELMKFKKTVCCAYLVTRNEDNTVFKIKTSDLNNELGVDFTRTLFSNECFSGGQQDVTFSPAFTLVPDKNFPTSISPFYEYSFCRDVALLDKQPLFGYVAARLFQKQGKIISVDNILLGETPDGTPLFASEGEPISFSSKLTHRFVAGSRSGKGVMTMNVLASTIASDGAVFYVDRKPDMASLLANLSNEKMFVVNGGSLSGKDDTFHEFTSQDKMLKHYYNMDKSVFKRKYLTTPFGHDFGDSYEGKFGDFIYLKGFMLALGIIVARIYYTKYYDLLTSEGKLALKPDTHVTVVVDEVTNWHHLFEHKYFPSGAGGETTDGIPFKYFKPSIGASTVDSCTEFDNILDDLSKDDKSLLEARIQAYNNAKAEWEQDRTDTKALKALDAAKNSLEKTLTKASKKASSNLDKSSNTLNILYWTTLFDKYKAFITKLGEIANAGFSPSMLTQNDVFMIGQSLNGIANIQYDPITLLKTGEVARQGTPEFGFKVNTDTQGNDDTTRSYLFGFAEAFTGGCDWFIGRNVTDKESPVTSDRVQQFGGGKGGNQSKELDTWIHSRGNWAYLPAGTQEKFRYSLTCEPVLLKPYLVLNTSDEFSGSSEQNYKSSNTSPYTKALAKEHEKDTYTYVYQCAQRVGFNDWEKIREKHVVGGCTETDKRYGHLDEGIGLKGLITEYRRTIPEYKDCEFNPDWLRTSGDIANAVCKAFGYNSYQDYLFDLSPTGLICCDDIISIFNIENANKSEDEMLAIRFPRYANTNNLAMLKSKNDSQVGSESGMNLSIEDIENLNSESDNYSFPAKAEANNQEGDFYGNDDYPLASKEEARNQQGDVYVDNPDEDIEAATRRVLDSPSPYKAAAYNQQGNVYTSPQRKRLSEAELEEVATTLAEKIGYREIMNGKSRDIVRAVVQVITKSYMTKLRKLGY